MHEPWAVERLVLGEAHGGGAVECSFWGEVHGGEAVERLWAETAGLGETLRFQKSARAPQPAETRGDKRVIKTKGHCPNY